MGVAIRSTRFCLWGAREGYVQVGSLQDRLLQRLLQREWAILFAAARQAGEFGRKLGVPLAKAAEDMRRFVEFMRLP